MLKARVPIRRAGFLFVGRRAQLSATHTSTRPLAPPLEHFCAVIRGEVEPLVTVRDGLQNLRVVEAIAEAARTGHLVAVEDDR
ncbi:Gfo/Idh/MocA family oxidoreductase [Crenobacter sp. SG2305]|uniref:Gfo/Idh/MocA family oxidoreductase n=1 Tax=Crenobacter oryzisoli TaxID=3056844 RepID=UPI0025AB1733|nr:Gfo/Idh/MocA family oxidoreductase [Crenobacter sp. SG2305]MDN0081695.1 Gfo/Idh/MocA family oxidoreductase [Crenobacter sp. SG2305]